MGPIIANNLGAGFVTLRKPGKLPAETWSESYEKEYEITTNKLNNYSAFLCGADESGFLGVGIRVRSTQATTKNSG